MSDIVDRLNNEWADYENDPALWRCLCACAADEISSLREQVRVLRSEVAAWRAWDIGDHEQSNRWNAKQEAWKATDAAKAMEDA